MTTVGVITFPGSLDDRDTLHALRHIGFDAEKIWHGDASIDVDAVVLPGGFSHGDYLRCGAMAATSPVMAAVKDFANAGKPVLGICNGFQILCEAGLLPGALTRNAGLRFQTVMSELRIDDDATALGDLAGSTITIPAKHGEGRWVVDPQQLATMQANGQIALRYADNHNGSTDDVAGITNEAGNVLGLMPHPEHAVEEVLGRGTDGAKLLNAFLRAVVPA